MRYRISRIIAADVADMREQLADVDEIRNEFIKITQALRQQGIDLLNVDPLSQEQLITIREEFENYKDNYLLQLWNSAVGLTNSEVQHQFLLGGTSWDPDLKRVEADLLNRCDLLPSNDRARLVIAEFLIACGRLDEGIIQVRKTDQDSLWVARCYLGGRACIALGHFCEAYDYLQGAMTKKDFRRAFFLAGQALRRCKKAGDAAFLFDEAASLSDFTWTSLTNLPANTSAQRRRRIVPE